VSEINLKIDLSEFRMDLRREEEELVE